MPRYSDLLCWVRSRRPIEELSMLDERLLRDLGIVPHDAREAIDRRSERGVGLPLLRRLRKGSPKL